MDHSDILKVCQDCGAKCCKLGGTSFTSDERTAVLQTGKKDKMRKIGHGHYEVKCRGAVCSYLNKDNSCSIHETRPLMCRRWPVFTTIDEGRREMILIGCPLATLLSDDDIEHLKRIDGMISDRIVQESIENSLVPDYAVIDKRVAPFSERVI